MIALAGGCRAGGPVALSFRAILNLFWGVTRVVQPVEEVIAHASPWRVLAELLADGLPCGHKEIKEECLDVIICGHSLGVGLAKILSWCSSHLGFELRGVLALDYRCVDRTALGTVIAPRALSQSFAVSGCCQQVVYAEFVAPHVPRGA